MLAPSMSRDSRPSRRASERKVDKDDAALMRKLDAYCDRWMAKEGTRRARDRRGMRMFRGDMWERSFGDSDGLQITSNTPLALFERVVAETLRGMPEPEIEAIEEEDEDAARVAQGALRTNWRTTRFWSYVASGYRLSGFTRAVGMYHYWRHELHGGKGDVDHRIIPAHRLIVDDRTPFARDMKFIGFEEDMSRAELITLFPDKTSEIERAGSGEASAPVGINPDPLLPTSAGQFSGNTVVDRLVAQGAANTPPYTPTTSIKNANSGKSKDPLSETVKVRFMWIDDPSPTREKRPRLDPKTKKPLYQPVRDELTGKPVIEHEGHDVINTKLGPQYVPRMKPKFEMVMDEVVVRKYKYRRHIAYVKDDSVKLWDVAWDGPIPISILRDRVSPYGFDAPGTALRLDSLAIARNVLWTIIFQRLKKSLAGSWITHAQSGLKRNSLLNEIGNVYTVNTQDLNSALKEFPMTPLDAAYFNLLDKIEQEEELLIGVTQAMKGQPIGRADSPQTYEQVADQSGGPILDRAKIIDQFVQDAAEIDIWFMQNYYTHEHVVEAETAEGFATWTQASALAIRGDFAVRIETGSSLGRNATRDRDEANQNAQAGFYALPMLGRMGRVRNWRQALKQRAAIMRMGPQYNWLLGASGATPQQQQMSARASQQRSHHKPGGK